MDMTWVKSSHSGNEGDCVAVAALSDGSKAVRDSKDPNGPVLRFTAKEWKLFIDRIRLQS